MFFPVRIPVRPADDGAVFPGADDGCAFFALVEDEGGFRADTVPRRAEAVPVDVRAVAALLRAGRVLFLPGPALPRLSALITRINALTS
ncbi:hypothetical protein GCM10027605_07090 [Micromonospora zhanjiangensis]